MTNNVIAFEKKLPHLVSEVICVKCGYRVIAARPKGTLLKTLECGSCGLSGFIIETGEAIES